MRAFGPNLAEFFMAIKAPNRRRRVTLRMRVAVEVLAPVGEPYVQVQDEHVLGVMLRSGFIEVGLQRSAMRRVTFQAGSR